MCAYYNLRSVFIIPSRNFVRTVLTTIFKTRRDSKMKAKAKADKNKVSDVSL